MPESDRSSGNDTAVATLAGGCFWCLEAVFQPLRGVVRVVSGYTGGRVPNPSYQAVCTGMTGHAEAVEVTFEPEVLSYRELLELFFAFHDPTTLNRQGPDDGTQYRSAIFYLDDTQKRLAEESKHKVEESKHFGKPIQTQIVAASTFYPAEEYHQDFYKKNPVRYKFYQYNCGRAKRLEELWGNH